MKEQRPIIYYIRDFLLRKTLYYSILYFVFSLILAIGVSVYNYFILPELSKIQAVLKGIGTVWIIIGLLGPIRWLFLFGCTWLLPEHWFYSILKKYDEGRLKQGTQLLRANNKIQLWASDKVFSQVRSELVLTKSQWRDQFKPVISLIALSILISALVIIPDRIKTSSIDELIKGSYSAARPSISNIPDTLVYNYGDVFQLGSYTNCNAIIKENIRSGDIVDRNFIIDWKTKGRLVKHQHIIVDSIPTLSSVVCEITPPSYMELHPYEGSDTLFIYPNSRLEFNLSGLLLDKVSCFVSRETFNKNEVIRWTKNLTIVFKDNRGNSLYTPVIIELNDNPPIIDVLSNTRDTLVIKLSDDFGLATLYRSEQRIKIYGTQVQFNIPWANESNLTLTVSDNINQNSTRTINRPQESKELLIQRINSSVANKLGIQDEVKNQIHRSQKIEDDLKDSEELIEEQKKFPKPIEKIDIEYEEWLKELERLWNEELLIGLLNEVDTSANKSLDSALEKTVNELLSNESNKEKRDILEGLKKLPNQGEEREEQAKDAAKKLSELLNDDIAAVQEDNVERIKNLLKSSWLTSVLQEQLNAIALEKSKVAVQKNLFTIEANLQDSLAYLLIHDQVLSQALTGVSKDLGNSMRSLIRDFRDSKSTEVSIGYVIHDLNELSSILYEILESEKKALATANKNCKNGKPGKTGKPSSAGKGKPGPKGMPNEGKQPGGRKQGKNGESREQGNNGDKGSSGKGSPKESELLKQIEALTENAQKEGNKELFDELKRIKEDLLFNSGALESRIQEIEEKLWLIENSEFSKEEQGSERSSNQGQLRQEKEVEYEMRPSSKSGSSDLPLPVLKRK